MEKSCYFSLPKNVGFFFPLKENLMKERAVPQCREGLGDFLGKPFHWQPLEETQLKLFKYHTR